MDAPLVAIIGRPNVGKSTLFNRILRRRQAVTADLPGTTRDRTYALTDWNGRSFYIADTGGYIPDAAGDIDPMVKAQAEAAMAEADLILLLTDAQVGPQDVDLKLSQKLRRHDRPVIHVVNKSDTDAAELDASSHARLGLGEVVPVAAESGRGTGDLLDKIARLLPERTPEERDDTIRVAVVGRPNVGKSSVVNALIGSDRTVVSPVAGTTRDAVDTPLKFKDHAFTLVDTAGLRRRSKLEGAIEYYTTLRTVSAIGRAHVAVLVIAAPDQLTTQDAHIAAQVIEAGKGLIVAVNKWDLLQGQDHRKADRFNRMLKDTAPFLNFAPVLFVSALTGKGTHRILDTALTVRAEMSKRVPTSELNEFIAEVIEKQPPPAVHGKPVRIFYITQPHAGPARFVLFCSHPDLIPDSYKRFVHNQIRNRWRFEGVPVIISTRPRG